MTQAVRQFTSPAEDEYVTVERIGGRWFARHRKKAPGRCGNWEWHWHCAGDDTYEEALMCRDARFCLLSKAAAS